MNEDKNHIAFLNESRIVAESEQTKLAQKDDWWYILQCDLEEMDAEARDNALRRSIINYYSHMLGFHLREAMRNIWKRSDAMHPVARKNEVKARITDLVNRVDDQALVLIQMRLFGNDAVAAQRRARITTLQVLQETYDEIFEELKECPAIKSNLQSTIKTLQKCNPR